MKMLSLARSTFLILSGLGIFFATQNAWVFAATPSYQSSKLLALTSSQSSSSVKTENTESETPKETMEKKRAMDDVNSLIIDSYRVQLDKTLQELFTNIRIATKGDGAAQVKILEKVRDDLDAKLDALAASNVSTNRKKILLGVYFYLKSRIEGRIEELRGE